MSLAKKTWELFQLWQTDDQDASLKPKHSYTHAVDVQGKQVHVCRFETDNDSVRLNQPIVVQSWSLDATDAPVLTGPFEVEPDSVDLQLPLYSQHGSDNLQIVPAAASHFKPAALKLAADGLSIRVGSLNFPTRPPDQTSQDQIIPVPRPEQYWEESNTKGSFKVLSRRRKPKRQALFIDKVEADRVEKLKALIASHGTRLRSRRKRRYHSDSDSDSVKDVAVAYSDNMSIHSKSSAEEGFAHKSSSRSAPDVGINEEDMNDAILSDAGFSGSNTSHIQILDSSEDLIERSATESPENSTSGFSEVENDSSGTDSLRTAGKDDSTDQDVEVQNSADEDASATTKIDDSDLEGEGRVDYHINTIHERCLYECDFCDAELYTSFTCMLCESQRGFEICPDCVNKEGQWCYDKKHRMYQKLESGGLAGPIPWRPFTICQEIEVHQEFLINDTEAVILFFSWEGTEYTMLHESVPALHPTLPLVAWAPYPGKFLVADYVKKKEFSLRKLKPSVRKAKQISIEVHFSPCGLYLHVGTIEALRMYAKNAKETVKPKQYRLSFHVSTFRLPVKKPAKHRAKLVSRQSHALGISITPVISVLPFSWAWQPNSAYLTMNGEKLQLYWIKLPSLTNTGDENLLPPITTPSRPLELPCSVTDRAVQFLPAASPKEKAMFIVGPRLGDDGCPPAVVYVSQEDLGEWVGVKDVVAVKTTGGKRQGILSRKRPHYNSSSSDDLADDEA